MQQAMSLCYTMTSFHQGATGTPKVEKIPLYNVLEHNVCNFEGLYFPIDELLLVLLALEDILFLAIRVETRMQHNIYQFTMSAQISAQPRATKCLIPFESGI